MIALSALFIPHYLAGAFQVPALDHNPWDVVFGVAVIALIAGVRLIRRPSLYGLGIVVPALDLITQLLLVVLGFVFVFSGNALTHGLSLGHQPTWHALAFSLPLAMLAFTGLETVANLAEEARRPGVDLPRSVFGGIATVISVYVADRPRRRVGLPRPEHRAGTRWIRSPLLGIAARIQAELPCPLGDILRTYVGVTGALILAAAVTTSISGFSRLAYSLGEHGQLPETFGRLSRRSHVSPPAILAAALMSAGIVDRDVVHEARRRLPRQPVLVRRPGRVHGGPAGGDQAADRRARADAAVPRAVQRRRSAAPRSRCRRSSGRSATFAIWIIAMATHPAARYAGPIWLAAGAVVYVLVRRSHGESLTFRHMAPDERDQQLGPQFKRILVPMKLGIIGEEMIATAVKLAGEENAVVEALYVIRVPLSEPLDAERAEDVSRAEASLAEAKLLGEEHGVEVVGTTVRARAIGEAIVDAGPANRTPT